MGNQITQPQLSCGLPFNYHQQCQDWIPGGTGSEQSPIDIIPEKATPSNNTMKMEFFLTDHTLTGLKVNDTGNTLQVDGSFSKLRATDVHGDVYEFEAIQFHFHAPAEHTINGKHYDLELHIVHQMTPESAKNAKTKRNLAVVAVFFELDKEKSATPNAFIDALKLQNVGGVQFNMNMNDLFKDELKDMMTYYAYKGSLTTPPCTENANFYVLEKPLTITKSQLDHFNLRWKDNFNFAGGNGNNRPVQPLNGRVVMKSTNCCVKGRSEEVRKAVEDEKKTDMFEFSRDIMFEDLSLVGHNAVISTQGFVGTGSQNTKKNPPPQAINENETIVIQQREVV